MPFSVFADESGSTHVFPAYNLEEFTIIVLPDTQFYSQSYPEIFDCQVQWILDNLEPLNIIFVSHLGDLVDVWSDEYAWENANHSMSMLDGAVPWAVLPGNHDGVSVSGDLRYYEQFFGIERFQNYSWYGGAYQNDNANSYQLFSGGGDDYLIFHLQYDPSDAVLLWADKVIDKYPDRRVIVSTHEYMGAHFFPSLTLEIGETIWNKLVKLNGDQIFLVLCGHLSLEQQRTDTTVDGYNIYQMVSDYQDRENGGDGWLRILTFSPLQEKIFVKTYSPYLDEYEQDANSEFVLDYNMTSNQEYVSIQSNSELSGFCFGKSEQKISFVASGATGTSGYCTVSVPKTLVDADSWTVNVATNNIDYTVSSNSSHSLIHFSYTNSEFLQVSVVPNASLNLVLPLFVLLLCLVACVLVFRKKLLVLVGKRV
ncbi:MAG: metallophosphoesterase [Candidatus Bathyarchaeia archaeon]|jgi:hypothetical protein